MLHCRTPVCSDGMFDDGSPRGLCLGRTPRQHEFSRFHYSCWKVEFKTWINCNIPFFIGVSCSPAVLLIMFLRKMLWWNFEINTSISIRTLNHLSFLWRWGDPSGHIIWWIMDKNNGMYFIYINQDFSESLIEYHYWRVWRVRTWTYLNRHYMLGIVLYMSLLELREGLFFFVN